MSHQRAIIFDLDDTLYAEVDFVASGFRSVARWAAQEWKFPASRTMDELNHLQETAPLGRIFNTWLSNHGFDDNQVLRMVEVYREHTPDIAPFPDVRETITALGLDYRIGLISDGFLTVQQNKFRALGLGDLFDSVVFSDALGREHWKPDRLPYETSLNELEVDGIRSIYVGDNPTKDFFGARQAGMMSIRTRHPKGVYENLEPESEAHAADTEIQEWSELNDAIEKLFNV